MPLSTPQPVNSIASTVFSNADYTIPASIQYVGQTGTLSARRTVTLPTASSIGAGKTLTITDESRTCSYLFKISIIPAGSDTLDGFGSANPSLYLDLPGQSVELISNGSNSWRVKSIYPTHHSTSGVNYQNNLVTFGLEGFSTSASPQSHLLEPSVGGTGALIDRDFLNNQPVFTFLTGSVSGDRSRLRIFTGLAIRRSHSTNLRCEFLINLAKTPTVTTDEFNLILGITNIGAVTGEPSDGYYFLLNRNDATSATNWIAVNSVGSVRTKTDTGVAFTAGTRYALAIDAPSSGNIVYYINGVQVASIGTNISAAALGFTVGHWRDTGTTSSVAFQMYRFKMHQILSSPRFE